MKGLRVCLFYKHQGFHVYLRRDRRDERAGRILTKSKVGFFRQVGTHEDPLATGSAREL